MATIRVDGELNRIASEVLADSGRFLVVEIQALIAPQARWWTMQKWPGVGANQLRLISGTQDRSSWNSVIQLTNILNNFKKNWLSKIQL